MCSGSGTKIEKYFCSVAGCKKSELAPVQCNFCSVQICLSHRHQQDHHCPQYSPPEKTMTATKAVIQVQEMLTNHNRVFIVTDQSQLSIKAVIMFHYQGGEER